MRLHEPRGQRKPLPVERRELIDATDLGRLLSVSRGTIAAWHADGRLPEPVRLGNAIVRYRTAEIRAWLAAGCPVRGDWTWRPAVPVRLYKFIESLASEAAEIETRLAELRAREAAGETRVPAALAP